MQKEVEMVSEKPPRRSKVEKDPITIDLTPEESRVVETDVVAEPVRSNDTDEPLGAKGSSQDEFPEAVVNEPPKAEEPHSAVDEAAKDEHPEPAAAEATSSSEQPRFDDDDAPSRPDTSESSAQSAALHAAARQKRSNPATSTLVASGIFGGIVALLLAGAMQYAGVLPGASSDNTSDTSALSDEIDALRQEIHTLSAQPAGADTGLVARVQALEAGGGSNDLSARLAAIEKQIGDVKSATAATASNDADLSRRLQQAETKMNDRGPEQQVARAIAAAALKAAIDRGGAFEPELQTYEGLAANDPAVAGLKPFAAKGVPSRAELQREFPRVADAMIEAATVPDPNQGIAGRLLSSALSVVKVRRVGEVEGDTAEAIVARMEQSLQNGDLTGALREWKTLPEPAKAASSDYSQKLDARMKVEDLVGGTLSRALAGTQG
jgi:hypothetical protein